MAFYLPLQTESEDKEACGEEFITGA